MENEALKFITRTSEPTKLDTARYRSLCKVINSSHPELVYIQLSKDQENPNWFLLGSMVDEETFLKLIDLLS